MAPKKLTWRHFLTAEPVIFFYAYGLFMHLPVIQQYIYHRIAESKGFPYDVSKKSGCGNESLYNASMKNLEREVQSHSSYVHLGIVMFSSLPSIFMSLLIGSWTDSRGRKPALLLPVIGSTLEAIVTIMVMYFKWPVYVLFIGGAINGFCGYFTTIVMGVMAYISDTTDESQRPVRLAIMEALTFGGGMVSQLTSGLWIEKFGFIAPYWFILACLAFSLLFVIFLVPESRPKEDIKETTAFCSCNSIKRIWKVYMTPREGGRRNLFLLTCNSALMQLGTQGVTGVIVLFVLHTPLCFSPEMVGYFSGFRYLCIGVGAIIGIKLLGRWLTELSIVRIGIVTSIGSLVLFGFSVTPLMVFMVPLAGIFNGCVVPIFRAMLSRIISKDEQGAMFSAVASLETLCTFVGAFIFNSLYPASLKVNFPGFVFMLGAVLTLLPLLFTCCFKNPTTLLSKRDIVQIGGYDKMAEDNLQDPTARTDVVSDESSSINEDIRSRGSMQGYQTHPEV